MGARQCIYGSCRGCATYDPSAAGDVERCGEVIFLNFVIAGSRNHFEKHAMFKNDMLVLTDRHTDSPSFCNRSDIDRP